MPVKHEVQRQPFEDSEYDRWFFILKDEDNEDAWIEEERTREMRTRERFKK